MRDSDKVKAHVLRSIAAGTARAGDRLPTERELCAALSVGRGALREALAVLESEGRVQRRAGSGTYVARHPEDRPAAEVSPAHVMAARLVLEPPIAHLVTTHATLADFARMDHCLAEGARAPDMAGFERWDGALHAAIVEAAHNPLVGQAYALIMAARAQDDWGTLKRRSLTPHRRLDYQADHETIVAALRLRDHVAGEVALRAHLVRVRSHLLDP